MWVSLEETKSIKGTCSNILSSCGFTSSNTTRQQCNDDHQSHNTEHNSYDQSSIGIFPTLPFPWNICRESFAYSSAGVGNSDCNRATVFWWPGVLDRVGLSFDMLLGGGFLPHRWWWVDDRWRSGWRSGGPSTGCSRRNYGGFKEIDTYAIG